MCSPDFFSANDDVPPRNSKERQTYFLEKAARAASKSTMGHKHGCVIVHDDVILSEGWNKLQSYYNHAFSVHAEVDAIHKCRKKYKDVFNDVEMYIVRIGADSMDKCLKYSKPCERCREVIKRFGIRKVYYSTNYEFDLLMNGKQ